MKIIKYDHEAILAFKRGIDKNAKAVIPSLGPNGKIWALGRRDNTPTMTGDGVSISRHIDLDDEVENEGSLSVKEVAATIEREVLDATTTGVTIYKGITDDVVATVNDLIENPFSKASFSGLKEQIDEECEFFSAKLKEKAKIVSKEDYYDIVKVAVRYPHLAKVLAEVYTAIGANGHVKVEYNSKPVTEYVLSKGMAFDFGYASEQYKNYKKDDEENEEAVCRIEKPNILVSAKGIDIVAVSQITKFIRDKMSVLINAGSINDNLIICAPEFSQEALAQITKLFIKGIPVVPVKIQDFGNFERSKDLCAMTNATLVDKNEIKPFDELDVSIIGNCDEFTANSSKTLFAGGEGDTTKRVADIKKALEESDSIYDKEQYEKRIAYLTAGTAVIKVGAITEDEKTLYKLRVDDGLKTIPNAIKNGVVRGGGLALKELADEYPDKFLSKALKLPYEQIQASYGGKYVIPENVNDAFDAINTALRVACSKAGTFSMLGGVSTNKRIDEKRDSSES